MNESSSAAMGTYLYGIARGLSAGPPAMSGVGDGGAEIRILDGGSHVAVVSDVTETFVEATANDLQRHSDVLQELLGSTEALVPMRFGTVYPDDQSVRGELLERGTDELGAVLDSVENRVEARLKAFYIEEAILAEILTEQPRVAELRRRTQALPTAASYYERIRLGEVVASALAVKRREDGEAILARLVPFTVDYLVEEEAHDWAALTASFLLDRSKLEDFHSAVSELADTSEHRLQLRCVAPLPPYSFVTVPLDSVQAEAAWAS
jgi:gas vesicle protein GvpL/GvpF